MNTLESEDDRPASLDCDHPICNDSFIDRCAECNQSFCAAHLKTHHCKNNGGKTKRTRTEGRWHKQLRNLPAQRTRRAKELQDEIGAKEMDKLFSSESEGSCSETAQSSNTERSRLLQRIEEAQESVDSRVKPTQDRRTTSSSPKRSNVLNVIFGPKVNGSWSCSLPSELASAGGYRHSTTRLSKAFNAWRHLQTWHPSLNKAEILDSSKLKYVIEMYRRDPYIFQSTQTLQEFGFIEIPQSQVRAKFRQAFFFVVNHIPYAAANDNYTFAFEGLVENESALITPWQIANKYLPAMMKAAESILRAKLETASGIAISYDLWTDSSQKKYLIVTCHFIDGEWNRVRALLSIEFCNVPATADYLQRTVKDIIRKKLNRDVPIASFVTDGASNMIASADILSAEDNIWCTAHRLHLVITEAVESSPYVSQLVANIRAFVAAMHRSTNATSLLEKIQRSDQSIRVPLKTLGDSPTRWSSTYRMLERFFKLLPSILRALIEDTSFPNPGPIETPILSSLVDILEPFSELTTKLQSDASTCYLFQWIGVAYRSLERLRLDKNLDTRLLSFVINIKNNLDKRFSSEFTEATIFMKAAMFIPFPRPLEIEDSLWDEIKTEICNDIIFMHPLEERCLSSTSLLSRFTETIPQISEKAIKAIQAFDHYSNHLDKYHEIFEKNYQGDYKNILTFWKEPPPELLPMKDVVRFLLSVPPSSAAAESYASIMGISKSKFRSRLSPVRHIQETTVAINSRLASSKEAFCALSESFLDQDADIIEMAGEVGEEDHD